MPRLPAWIGVLLFLGASARYIQPDPLPSPSLREPVAEQHRALLDDAARPLPRAFDWRDARGGRDFTSPIRSQYLPVWCGSCWAHAVTSALADRVNVLRGGARSGGSVMLSVQNYLDCGKAAGTCAGGSWERAFAWAAEHGVADDSCAPYLGRDGECGDDDAATCKLCFANGSCVPVPGARRFHVARWGYVNASTYGSATADARGLAAMQAEILARGPIVCSMMTDDDANPRGAWHCYEGGVYRTDATFQSTNHVISLLGWGEEPSADGGESVPYWIGRHSGGTIFGEEGFFRIERGVNALNIESHCGYATVRDPYPPRAPDASLPCENGVPRAA